MDVIQRLTAIDCTSWIITGFLLLSIFIAGYEIIGKFSEIIGKPVNWVRSNHTDHQLLIQTSQNLSVLQEQISALMQGSKELLGAEIDKRYRDYIMLNSIPESDVDEFQEIFDAYKALNGNHRRDLKYQYVRDRLPVIPVETKLIVDEK